MVSPRIRVIDATAKTPDRESSAKRAALHSTRVLPKSVTRGVRVATLMRDQPSSGTTLSPIRTRAARCASRNEDVISGNAAMAAARTGTLALLAGSSSNATASVVQKGRPQPVQGPRKPSPQFQRAPSVSIIPLAPAMHKSAAATRATFAQQPQASISGALAFPPVTRAPAAKRTVRTRVMPSPSPPPRKRQTAPCRFKRPEHRVSPPPSMSSLAVSAPSTATKSSQTMDAAPPEKGGQQQRHSGRKRTALPPRQRRPTGIRTAGVQKKKEPVTKQLEKWTTAAKNQRKTDKGGRFYFCPYCRDWTKQMWQKDYAETHMLGDPTSGQDPCRAWLMDPRNENAFLFGELPDMKPAYRFFDEEGNFQYEGTEFWSQGSFNASVTQRYYFNAWTRLYIPPPSDDPDNDDPDWMYDGWQYLDGSQPPVDGTAHVVAPAYRTAQAGVDAFYVRATTAWLLHNFPNERYPEVVNQPAPEHHPEVVNEPAPEEVEHALEEEEDSDDDSSDESDDSDQQSAGESEQDDADDDGDSAPRSSPPPAVAIVEFAEEDADSSEEERAEFSGGQSLSGSLEHFRANAISDTLIPAARNLATRAAAPVGTIVAPRRRIPGKEATTLSIKASAAGHGEMQCELAGQAESPDHGNEPEIPIEFVRSNAAAQPSCSSAKGYLISITDTVEEGRAAVNAYVRGQKAAARGRSQMGGFAHPADALYPGLPPSEAAFATRPAQDGSGQQATVGSSLAESVPLALAADRGVHGSCLSGEGAVPGTSNGKRRGDDAHELQSSTVDAHSGDGKAGDGRMEDEFGDVWFDARG